MVMAALNLIKISFGAYLICIGLFVFGVAVGRRAEFAFRTEFSERKSLPGHPQVLTLGTSCSKSNATGTGGFDDKVSCGVCDTFPGCLFAGVRSRHHEERRQGVDGFGKSAVGCRPTVAL